MTFLDKPGREAPRPIRVGEWLRKLVGKSGLKRHNVEIGKIMERYNQYGVAMPGGCEALCHARGTIEELAATGAMGALAMVDVDLVNCFPSVEWRAIVAAYAAYFRPWRPGNAGLRRNLSRQRYLEADAW